MTESTIDRCLSLLREVDHVFLVERELALAAHLSLVIELLALRQSRGAIPG